MNKCQRIFKCTVYNEQLHLLHRTGVKNALLVPTMWLYLSARKWLARTSHFNMQIEFLVMKDIQK